MISGICQGKTWLVGEGDREGESTIYAYILGFVAAVAVADGYLIGASLRNIQGDCHPVVIGPAVYSAVDLSGIEGGEEWTNAALFRYRSRRAFMEIISNPDILGPHDFKLAALDKTIAYPMETDLYLGDPRLLLGLILLTLTALADLWRLSAAKSGIARAAGQD